MSLIAPALMGALLGVSIGSALRNRRRAKAAQALIRRIQQAEQPLYCAQADGISCQTITQGRRRSGWQKGVIAVTRDGIAAYALDGAGQPCASFSPADLRWFGRPRKYSSGRNEIWLHAGHERRWILLRVRLSRLAMHALVRALKVVATAEQVTAYRRRRPYIHYGPAQAHPARQDIHGAWTLAEPVGLYLMPSHIVVLSGEETQRAIPLEAVQNVSAIRRLDRPEAAGLLRFDVGGEPLAFALDRHEMFAAQVAEAARRTLEDPVQWARKKKKDIALEEEELDDEELW
ncbi:MAG: hypothetical protein M5U29_16710 [Anaerolineae bacterium]|nr:hypothetical protein [Anaerolineae bacterium]